jgi:guanine deaminase
LRTAYRASIYHCLRDPGNEPDETAGEYFEDGLLIVNDGCVEHLGEASSLLDGVTAGTEFVDMRGKLILPGFVDCHVHYTQIDIVAAYGAKLLDWLNRYAYPAEARFSDPQHAREVAQLFLQELLRNGTTTAMVFTTIHPQAVDAIFEEAAAKDMRLIAGKVLMDQHCPDDLRDTPESAYSDSKRLIEKWHGQGRLGYAITPRFALTSSDAQLAAAGKLAAEHDDVWIHTHLAENVEEVDAIARQYPDSRSYLDVYERFGLLRRRSMFAHCLYLDDCDRALMAERAAAGAFCPTSNLFLGSGLFDLDAMTAAGVNIGLATDVGGGTSLSMFRTMDEAYKVLHMRGQRLPASRAIYLATLGAAAALDLQHVIGNLQPGKEADFVVIDPQASPATARRAGTAKSIDELLFSLIFLADDRNVAGTYLRGRAVS